jgi:hypothetical protein
MDKHIDGHKCYGVYLQSSDDTRSKPYLWRYKMNVCLLGMYVILTNKMLDRLKIFASLACMQLTCKLHVRGCVDTGHLVP